MSMDYVSPLQQNKRRREGELDQWDCKTKRVCNGFGSCVQVGCDVRTDSLVDTWDIQQQVDPQNTTGPFQRLPSRVVTAPGSSAQQCCPRCMAGEPGHINHIMQRY